MTRIADHVQTLAQPFAGAESQPVASTMKALAEEIQRSESDDGLIDIGEHSQIWLKVKTARQAAARYQSSLTALQERGVLSPSQVAEQSRALETSLLFLERLGRAQDTALRDGQLRGYTLALRGTEPVVRPDASRRAFVTNIAGGGYTTYVPQHLFNQHLDGAFRPQGADGRTVSQEEFVDSGLKYADTRSGREASFADVYNHVKRRMFETANLRVGALGGTGRELSVANLMAGKGELKAETFRGVELPSFLGGGRRDVEGVRLAWVVAASLRDSGVAGFEASRVQDWMARGDVAAATNAIVGAIDALEVGAYDGYVAMLHAQGERGEGLRQIIEGGIVAASHSADGRQILPDYQLKDGGGTMVRSPSGPLVLLYDPPLGNTRPAGDASPYRFGVDGLNFHVKQGTSYSAGDPSLEYAGQRLQTEEGLDAVADHIYSVVYGALMPGVASGALGQHGPELEQINRSLDDAIHIQRQILAGKRGELQRLESKKGFLESMWFDSSAENQLEDDVGALQDWVDRAEALRGGTHLLLGALAPEGGVNGPGYWRARLSEAFGKVDAAAGGTANAGWENALALLALEQQDARQASAGAQGDALAIKESLQQFYEEEVSWHQAWGWMDKLIGGESAQGHLYRDGKELKAEQSAASEELSRVAAGAADDVIGGVHRFLMATPTEDRYRTDFGDLERVRPAYEALLATQNAADEARTSLARADSAILHRNMVAASEPYPETERVAVHNYEGEITHYEDRETSAHSSWQWQYDSAKTSALHWSSRAESDMKDLGRELPHLKRELQRAGFQDFIKGNLNTDIDPLLHYFFDVSFLWYSFDHGKVDRMQRDVSEIAGQLSALRYQVEPQYQQFRSAVDGRRREEHQRLLEVGRQHTGRH